MQDIHNTLLTYLLVVDTFCGQVPLPPADSWGHHHHLVSGGLSRVGVALCVRVVIDVLGVVINVVAVVVVVGIAGY